jgi:hypothetical protein
MADPICTFCGVNPPSREHVIPRWMARLFPNITWAVTNTLTGRIRKDTRYINVIARGPCQPCNNGWLNEIEKLAKPILIPLINGLPSTLSPRDQVIIGTWFVGRAMMYDIHSEDRAPRPRYFHDDEHRQFMQTLTFEPSYSIYIGRYVGAELGLSREDHFDMGLVTSDTHRPVGNALRGYSFTLVFKYLVLQIFCIKTSESFIYNMPDLEAFCTQIGVDPIDIAWPPAFPFSDLAIQDFADRWSKYMRVAPPREDS